MKEGVLERAAGLVVVVVVGVVIFLPVGVKSWDQVLCVMPHLHRGVSVFFFWTSGSVWRFFGVLKSYFPSHYGVAAGFLSLRFTIMNPQQLPCQVVDAPENRFMKYTHYYLLLLLTTDLT